MFRNTHPATALFFGALAAAIYAAVLVGPLYVDQLDIREAVAVAHLRAARITDEGIRSIIRERTRGMGTHWETGPDGESRLVPGLGLTDEQILIDRDPYSESVRIAVNYERHVRLRPTQRTWTLDFGAAREGVPGEGR